MQLHLHQTHNTIGDFEEIFSYLKDVLESNKGGLHLFPELYLTGYPLQDLCLNKYFYDSYTEMMSKLSSFSSSLSQDDNKMLLVGGLQYERSDEDHLERITNVIFKIVPGKKPEAVYTKQLLPDYDIFDEKKYFIPGEGETVLEFNDQKIALLICEDMWPSRLYGKDPVDDYLNQDLDLVINLSASPYHVRKHNSRIERAKEIANLLNCPFAYVNRVGGEDEILFDGQSFIVDGQKVLKQAKAFLPEVASWQSEQTQFIPIKKQKTPHTWASLFNPQLDTTKRPSQIIRHGEDEYAEILHAIQFGIQEYARKCGFHKFLIALSGGIDSAVVLAATALSLKEDQSIEAVYMPGQFSAGVSHDLSLELCQKLGVPFKVLPIKFLHSAVKNAFVSHLGEPLQGISDENIQSRIRGSMIYARSNQTGAMVINTSNKSELAVGYSTQYGDSVGAISMLGDLYKTEVFGLANYINQAHGVVIPEGIITRPPSAELRADQKDEDCLPEYSKLDAILEGILSYRLTVDELCEQGHVRQEVEKTVNLYMNSEFKRFQFCPIIKLKPKSFGFGYRIPTSKNRKFYLSN